MPILGATLYRIHHSYCKPAW